MIREAESEPSREELIALIAALRAENASLKARIAELESALDRAGAIITLERDGWLGPNPTWIQDVLRRRGAW